MLWNLDYYYYAVDEEEWGQEGEGKWGVKKIWFISN